MKSEADSAKKKSTTIINIIFCQGEYSLVFRAGIDQEDRILTADEKTALELQGRIDRTHKE